MKKNLLAGLLTATFAISALTGCGSTSASVEDNTAAAAAEETTEAASTELTTIKVAASATPHAEILEAAAPLLEAKGYKLDVTVFDDYVQPNLVVESGEFDANYFQHVPYLDSFNEEQGTHLVNAGGIHYEPFGIYPGTKASLDDVAKGDVIALPNDTTNEARALLLLEANGLITLNEDAGVTATVLDIEENPYNLEIEELEAAQIPRSIEDVDFAVINGNYALSAGVTGALAYEASDSLAAETYANIVCVKEGNEETEKTKALVNAILSDEVRDYINDQYQGAVVPVF